MGGAGAVGGRVKSQVVAVVSVVCQAASIACLAYLAWVAYGTTAGVDAGRAGMSGGGRKDPVAATACAYWRA